MIKATWEGISGGDAVENAVAAFFAGLRERAGARSVSAAPSRRRRRIAPELEVAASPGARRGGADAALPPRA